MNDSGLKYFINRARACGLITGLAGSLKLTDIQPLLKLDPDFLGFRSALCDKNQRNNLIDMQAAHNVRAMIPVLENDEFKDRNLLLSMN
jgi:dihydroneopterin aldolase